MGLHRNIIIPWSNVSLSRWKWETLCEHDLHVWANEFSISPEDPFSIWKCQVLLSGKLMINHSFCPCYSLVKVLIKLSVEKNPFTILLNFFTSYNKQHFNIFDCLTWQDKSVWIRLSPVVLRVFWSEPPFSEVHIDIPLL